MLHIQCFPEPVRDLSSTCTSMHAEEENRDARRSDPKPSISHKNAHTQVVELKRSVVLYAFKTEEDFAPTFWFLICKILDAYILEV